MNIRRSAVIPAPEAAETRVTFGTITPASWTKLSGRVIGIDPGDERNVSHLVQGEARFSRTEYIFVLETRVR